MRRRCSPRIERAYKLPAEIRTLTNFASILGPLGEHLHRWTQAGQFGHSSTTSRTRSPSRASRPSTSMAGRSTRTFSNRCCSTCCSARRPRSSAGEHRDLQGLRHRRGWIFLQEQDHPRLDHACREDVAQKERGHDPGHAVGRRAGSSGHAAHRQRVLPDKIFLSNPNIDRKLYAEIFQLNDTQLELLESLVPKRDLLLIQPRGTKEAGPRSRCAELLDGDQQRPRQHPQTGLLRPLRAGARP
jgi:hypothetical protein